MFKFVKYLLGAGLIAGSTTVAAAGELPPEILDSVMASCRPDYHRLCSYVLPGDGRVARCLLDHETDVAPSCMKSLKIAYAMEVFMPDYRRLCNGVPPGGGQILECLGSRMEALAPECQRIVSANAPYASPGHERYSYNRGPYGGGTTNPEAYRYEPRPSETAPYPDRPYEDRYADRGFSPRPYGDAPYAEQGYNNPGYQQPAPNYPPAEENAPLK